MANPHHRKKRKHFHPPPHNPATAKKTRKATPIMTFGGGVFGLFIAYLAARDNIYIIIAGLIGGIVIGYFSGKKLDKSVE